MHTFLLFLSGVALFYLFPLFPFATGIIFVALSTIITLKKNPAAKRRVSKKNSPPLRGGDRGAGDGDLVTPTQPTPSRGRGIKERCLLVIVLILGFAYASFRHSPPLDPAFLGNMELIIGCVTDTSPQELSTGKILNEAGVKAAVNSFTGEYLRILEGKEMSIISDEGLKRGLRYVITAKTERDMERLNPSSTKNERIYARLEEVNGAEVFSENPVNAWFQDRRERLNSYLKNIFKNDSAALLSAMTTGERSAMSEELNKAFGITGLAHLLSISGTHFGLFSMLVFGIFRLGINLIPYRLLQRFTVYLTPSQAAALMSLPFILMYLLISGSSIPALRSFIMITIFLVGLLLGRKGFWLNSLLFAAFVICLWEPSAITNLSFQLSFLAVLFIGIILEDRVVTRNALRVTGNEQGLSARFLGILKNSLILSLSASLGTAPLVAYYFHYFSVISPVSNLVITPFIGFILVPLALFSSFIFIFSGHYPLQKIIAFTDDLAIKGVKFFASLPFADLKIPAFPAIVIVIFYGGLAWYFFSGRKRYALAFPLVSIMIFFISLLSGRDLLSVTFLDVGQGDSAVVEGYSGEAIVIDTGRTGKEVDAYLRYRGKKTVGALILSHADDDHSAGAPYVMKKFVVKEVWDNGLLIYPGALLENVIYRSLERGDELEGGGLSIQVLHPYKGFYTFGDNEAAEENNDSLVVRVAGRKKSFLFTGDIAEEAEEDMRHLGGWLKSDVIKVAHHGSRTSSSEAFLENVSPEIGVICVGRNNRYGHPHAETLGRLQGILLYRTDRDGAVKVTETADGLSVKTYRDFAFERTRSLGGEWRNIKRLFMKW